jgi:methionyl-tRNA formyltransferase
MRIRLLSTDLAIAEFLRACGDDLISGTETADWLISFGYRDVIPPEVLRVYENRAINLHISALPWNRGAHPNYWAWKDGTPHGVTLHFMTDKLDGGPMIAQRRLSFGSGFTYRTSWMRLQMEAIALFMEYWPELRLMKHGSYHSKSDLPRNVSWESPCA